MKTDTPMPNPSDGDRRPTAMRALRLGGGFMVLLIAVMAAVIGRCGRLGVYEHDQAVERALRQQLRIEPQYARRGSILDCRGRKLALSIRKYTIAADPMMIADPFNAAAKLAGPLGDDAHAIERMIHHHTGRRYVVLKRFVDDDTAAAVRALNINGLIVQSNYQRQYPMGTMAACVLGFTDTAGVGIEGLEKAYEHVLGGVAGKTLYRTDARGHAIAARADSTPARDGKSLVLTIDAVIQSITETEIAKRAAEYQAAGAMALVLDPTTGDVLAMAQVPTFDPGDPQAVTAAVRRNRALTDPFEPGSTFKPFTVAAALSNDSIDIDDVIDCHDGLYAGKGFGRITEYGNHRYGKLSITDIIVHSSNIGSAIIAQKMGKTHFYDMIERFGFGRRTGIDLPGEGTGILRPLSQWRWGDYALTRAAFGQGPVAVTALQLLRGFCVFANDGRLVRPRVASHIIDGDTIREVPPKEDHTERWQVIDANLADVMRQTVLTAVVDRKEGTAHRAWIDGMGVFGKTGTAQIVAKDGRGYDENRYISSFIAGAPAQAPQICVLVVVNEPNRKLGKGYTGGVVAAPVVRNIIAQTMAYLDRQDARPMETFDANTVMSSTDDIDEQN